MHIESYSFGSMMIDGTSYTSDLIIYPDGTILSSWWRKSGHSLVEEDIADVIKQAPEVIVVGTGAQGVMKPDPKLVTMLEQKGISFKPLSTGNAVEEFNRLAEEGCNVAGCFHLTC